MKNKDATGRNADVVGLETWDQLPAGIPCSAIGNYQYIAPRAGTGGTPVTLDPKYWDCEDGAPSYIKWKLPDSATPGDTFDLPTGQTLSLLYDMKIPDDVSVSTRFDNTASIRTFQTATNDGGVATFDSTASDGSRIRIDDVTLEKSATSFGEANNDSPNQATIGETITYTYTATIPAGSTVYNGRLFDELPTGIVLSESQRRQT